LQLKVKKHVVIGAIVFIWIAMSAYVATIAHFSTDIIQNMCVPWNSYSSYEAEKTISSLIISTTYLLPLLCMVACYSRVVYTLRHKVTTTLCSSVPVKVTPKFKSI